MASWPCVSQSEAMTQSLVNLPLFNNNFMLVVPTRWHEAVLDWLIVDECTAKGPQSHSSYSRMVQV